MRFTIAHIGVPIICLFSLAVPQQLNAQNQAPEFIESSSPTSNGGVVTSRVGADGQTRTSTTEGSSVNRSGSSSVLESRIRQPDNLNVFRPPTNNPGIDNVANLEQRYQYPAAAPPSFRLAQSYRGFSLPPVRATATCTDCPVPYQSPTLGLNTLGRNRTARQAYGPGSCCGWQPSTGVTALQVPATVQSPVLQIQPPVANQVPSLPPANFQSNSFNTFQPTTSNFSQNANSWWSPIASGSGVYQPVIRLANVRPGTYLGQGIIGQPTAYVDGQPLRNLLRYLSP